MSLFTTFDFPLRPLRITEGWRLGYNDFCDVPFDHPEAWRYAFKDSLLMLAHERRGMLVDPFGELFDRRPLEQLTQ